MFEASVVASGLPTVLAAASPPLGLLARLLAITLAFAAGSIAVWALVAPVASYLEAKARARTPWRDAGYGTETTPTPSELLPPRRPIFAPDELGAPLMSDEAISPVSPYQDVVPVPTGALLAEAEPQTEAPSVNAQESIADLIRRLETGLARRASPDGSPDGTGQQKPPLAEDATSAEDVTSQQAAATDNDGFGQTLSSFRRLATH